MTDPKAFHQPGRAWGKKQRQTDAITHALATGQRVAEVTREGTFELSLGEGNQIVRTQVGDAPSYAGLQIEQMRTEGEDNWFKRMYLQHWPDDENRPTSAPDHARKHPEPPEG